MSTFARDPFFDVPRTTRSTSAGPVELPILYYEVRNVVALFTADVARVREILVGTGLEAISAGSGRAVVGVSFYEYRRTSVGVYNEVGTAIFCVRAGERHGALRFVDLLRKPQRRRVGAYVVDLPVTTALANAAGREIWGYPKFVTPIDFSLDGRHVDAAVRDPDGAGDLCQLAGRLGRGVPAPPLSLMTYTRLDGALLRTCVDVRGRVMLRAPGTVTLRIGGSAHVMAAHLRALGLDGARPFLAMVTDRFQSLLHAGAVVD